VVSSKRRLQWLLGAAAAILCCQLACGLGSLDYLKNGRRDAEIDSTVSGPVYDGPMGDLAKSESAYVDGSSGAAEVIVRPDSVEGPATGGAQAGLDGSAGGTGGSADAAYDVAVADAGNDTSSVDFRDATVATGGTTTGGAGGVLGAGGTNGAGGASGAGGAMPTDAASPDAPPTKSVLFVVGTTPLNAGDLSIQSRLAGQGYTVTVVKDGSLGSSPTVVETIVLVSRTVASTNVGSKFRALAKPVIVCEPVLYADMGFIDTATGASGNTSTPISSIVVDGTVGALAAGLSGAVAVFTSAQQVGYGVPNAQAIRVASLPSQPTEWSIFAYEAGAHMPGLVAPGRRMGFFLSQTSASALTTEGGRLFDAAIAWLAGP